MSTEMTSKLTTVSHVQAQSLNIATLEVSMINHSDGQGYHEL